MGERLTKLQRLIAECQMWEDFSRSDGWKRLKERIENEVISSARDAFWAVNIDNVDDETLLRNMITQRAVIRVGYKIINMVDGSVAKKRQALKEVEKIEKKAGGKPTT